jgi:hypothetical protein
VVNLSKDHFRKLHRERLHLRRERKVDAEDDGQLSRVDARDELLHALQTLPPRQRAAVVLRHCEGLSEVGRDIGLAFPVCDVSRVRGIDLLGDGTAGNAWTATPVTVDGRCKKGGIEDSYLVAVDVTGDGLADASWSFEYCLFCEPLGATDFDGDGDDELVVLTQGGSVSEYSVFSASKESDGSVDIEPVSVADPGNPEGNLRAGKSLRMWAGGDEGFGAAVACEGYPEDPVVVVAWSNHPVEGPGSETTEVHVTRLVLRDGAFQVVDALNTEQPTEDPLPEVFSSSGKACGLEFGLF